MQHSVKSLRESLVPRRVRAGMDAGRTRAAEGNGRRTIVCTRNRTAPIWVARKMATLQLKVAVFHYKVRGIQDRA